MNNFFQKILTFFLYLFIFLLPFFFLIITHEYCVTNKFYLLGFGVLLLIFISTLQILVSKKISWQKNPFDGPIILFLTSVALSTLFSSPNKIQALLNPNFGLIMIIFLAILYFYISRSNETMKQWNNITFISSIILPLTTIILYFQPFKNITLPQNFSFIKNPGFTPVGSQLDLAILLGFFVVWTIVSFPRRRESSDSGSPIRSGMTLIINLLALFLIVYFLVKPSAGLINQTPTLILPPLRLSWYAALEILKNPQTAIIGIGPDNFSAIFTRVKDFAYNQSSLWQINNFNVSRLTILQILTETGIFGLLSFCILVFSVFKSTLKQWNNETMKPLFFVFIYLIICLFVFPPSLILWFLFFVTLGLINHRDTDVINHVSTVDLSDILPIYFGIVIISFGLIGTSSYFLGRSYASEYFFKKSIDGIISNNVKQIYDNQRQAIILNPYIEKFRSSFAQTNLLIASNLVKKKLKQIVENDRQMITHAIQASIAEGKAVVSLNPQKADNWQRLAFIYSNIINVAQGSDVWTISAYQRAISFDPQNPAYRVDLGLVYYSLAKYDDALRFFEQAISLKPDWPKANYNFALANFQKKNYPQAVNALQATLKLLDPKLNKTDYDKVQKELEEFKKMLPKTNESNKTN